MMHLHIVKWPRLIWPWTECTLKCVERENRSVHDNYIVLNDAHEKVMPINLRALFKINELETVVLTSSTLNIKEAFKDKYKQRK